MGYGTTPFIDLMTTNLARYKDELARLIKLGDEMRLGLIADIRIATGKLTKEQEETFKKAQGSFERNYQRWFTEASAVVKQLIPDRLKEFDEYYRTDPKRKTVNILTYRIQDWLNGARATTSYTGEKHFDDESSVIVRFQSQRQILAAAAARFDSALLDIRQVVQADLFDSELEMSRELLTKGFLRPAGVIAGVVVERHLGEVCANHAVRVKKDPTIGDLNDVLKANGTIDVPVWRSIQRLGDLRNIAAHNKSREPTYEEMQELIDGAERVTKTLF